MPYVRGVHGDAAHPAERGEGVPAGGGEVGDPLPAHHTLETARRGRGEDTSGGRGGEGAMTKGENRGEIG